MLNPITSLLNGSVEKKLRRKTLEKNDKAPLFTLPNINGECVQLEKLLSEGKSILVFYGLSWYRYSHFELLVWQELFEHIGNQNTKMLAIYPEEPDSATIVKWKADQGIEVLCDVGNKVARQFGLVARVSPTKARKLSETVAIDIISLAVEQEIELTIPATYVLDRDRTILHASFDTSGHNSSSVKEMLDFLI
ncbi:MAG: redoxin domain-containing protein [Planctomycetota bacterium]|jgi:peroxiredoxin